MHMKRDMYSFKNKYFGCCEVYMKTLIGLEVITTLYVNLDLINDNMDVKFLNIVFLVL